MRKLRFLLSIIIVCISGYMFYQVIQSNTPEQEVDYQVQGVQTKVTDHRSTESTTGNTYTSSNTNTSQNDFSVLVQSSLYNAVVSLDETSKEVNIKLLDDVSDIAKDTTSHYINISDTDLKYLVQNADSLFAEFKNGNLIDKYNLVTNMLKSYDTNINQEDLLGIGLSFLN